MKQKMILLGMMLCLHYLLPAQKQSILIKGVVTDNISKKPIPHASVYIKGMPQGMYTDDHGIFELSVTALPPVWVTFSYTGFESKEMAIHKSESGLSIELSRAGQLNAIIVTAGTRGPLPVILSPVSIETLSAIDIINSPSPEPDGALGHKNGVDVTSTSLTFNTISTRGYNGSGSSRVNQLVDGMDNQAPGLNFNVGIFAGPPILDVFGLELLPGASSALYGPGGMNGTILIHSKDPFKYQGFSVLATQGIMHVDKQQRDKVTAYYNYCFRYAKAFSDKFAFKIAAQYISGTDWLANDSSNYQRAGNTGKVIPGTRKTDPNYDGVNVYGDETKGDLRGFMMGNPTRYQQFLNTPQYVSRTGYAEKDVIDPQTKNIKLSGALHYKLTRTLEALLMGNWATGNTVYTGNNRYALKGIKIGQYKLELRNTNWFLRTYTTQEDAGQAYSATVTSQFVNEAWKPSLNKSNLPASWFPQYFGAFDAGAKQVFDTVIARGGTTAQAQAAVFSAAPQLHQAGRAFADRDRPLPGSDQFKQLFDKVRKTPIPQGGLFLEKSQLWMTEGQYNFANKVKFVDLIVGANWKKYVLNSDGTLFIDTLKPITFQEVGAYGQATKKLFSNYLTLSFSGRFDKNEDFKGKFTPRATALVKLATDNYLRFSYQTAYRFPTTQQKYIRLNVGDYMLLGGLPWVMDFMGTAKDPVVEIINGVPANGRYVYKEFKPESMQSFEMGYKGWIKHKLLIDGYVYLGQYNDFLGRNVLLQPSTGKIFSTVVNSTTKVKTYGFGASVDYRVHGTYSLFANAYSDVITHVPEGFMAFFNTPKYRVNAGFGNEGLGKKKRAGFNVVWRWQDGFYSDGDLASGPVKAFHTIDAQVSYKITKQSIIKLGGTNILNHYYQNSFANPKVGGLYYVSLGFNVL